MPSSKARPACSFCDAPPARELPQYPLRDCEEEPEPELPPCSPAARLSAGLRDAAAEAPGADRALRPASPDAARPGWRVPLLSPAELLSAQDPRHVFDPPTPGQQQQPLVRRAPNTAFYIAERCPALSAWAPDARGGGRCSSGLRCGYCHTADEHDFHPQRYKAQRCPSNHRAELSKLGRGREQLERLRAYCPHAHAEWETTVFQTWRKLWGWSSGDESPDPDPHGGPEWEGAFRAGHPDPSVVGPIWDQLRALCFHAGAVCDDAIPWLSARGFAGTASNVAWALGLSADAAAAAALTAVAPFTHSGPGVWLLRSGTAATLMPSWDGERIPPELSAAASAGRAQPLGCSPISALPAHLPFEHRSGPVPAEVLQNRAAAAAALRWAADRPAPPCAAARCVVGTPRCSDVAEHEALERLVCQAVRRAAAFAGAAVVRLCREAVPGPPQRVELLVWCFPGDGRCQPGDDIAARLSEVLGGTCVAECLSALGPHFALEKTTMLPQAPPLFGDNDHDAHGRGTPCERLRLLAAGAAELLGRPRLQPPPCVAPGAAPRALGERQASELGAACRACCCELRETPEQLAWKLRLARQLASVARLAAALATQDGEGFAASPPAVLLYGSSAYGLAERGADGDYLLARELPGGAVDTAGVCPTPTLHCDSVGCPEDDWEPQINDYYEQIYERGDQELLLMEQFADAAALLCPGAWAALPQVVDAGVPMLTCRPPGGSGEQYPPDSPAARTLLVTPPPSIISGPAAEDACGAVRERVRQLGAAGCVELLERGSGGAVTVRCTTEEYAVNLAAALTALCDEGGLWDAAFPGPQLPLLFRSPFDLAARPSGPMGTAYIGRCVTANPQWVPFLFYVKRWAAHWVLTGAARGGCLSSYCMLLLALDFLRTLPAEAAQAPYEYQDPCSPALEALGPAAATACGEAAAAGAAAASDAATGAALAQFWSWCADFDFAKHAVVFPSREATDQESRAAAQALAGARDWRLERARPWVWDPAGGGSNVMLVSDPVEPRANAGRTCWAQGLRRLQARCRAMRAAISRCPPDSASCRQLAHSSGELAPPKPAGEGPLAPFAQTLPDAVAYGAAAHICQWLAAEGVLHGAETLIGGTAAPLAVWSREAAAAALPRIEAGA
eukprot:TRINITY_DN7665_c3_g1_i1.p1 TRINITY_DN7665_c3_g1~~TRINITY_DN7665_c3_g1_i1.p1  ORF type:complete len:1311 (+),score=322.51 TRINITY_DN7665_c3_g1_i1:527-3934(+)